MTRLLDDVGRDPRAARGFRVEHGLSLIDAAARSCAVYDGRWVSESGEQAVAVSIHGVRWLVHPVDTGWVAVRRDSSGRPVPTRSAWLQRMQGKFRVPVIAWGRLLAGQFRDADTSPHDAVMIVVPSPVLPRAAPATSAR